MTKYVSILTVADGDDLIVSFGLGEQVDTSLTLLRTPKYEPLLPENERGVSVGTGLDSSLERELLVSLRWSAGSVQIESTGRRLTLDIRNIGPREIERAKAVLRKMNFDQRFEASGIEPIGPATDDHALDAVRVYDPESDPEPQSWLELNEHERIFLVENHHRLARIKVPRLKAHAAFHTIVENQIAMNLEPVVRAMERLMKEGLTRHDAVHAIASVVVEHMSDLMKSKAKDDAATSQSRYDAAVERLTAASWRRDNA